MPTSNLRCRRSLATQRLIFQKAFQKAYGLLSFTLRKLLRHLNLIHFSDAFPYFVTSTQMNIVFLLLRFTKALQ